MAYSYQESDCVATKNQKQIEAALDRLSRLIDENHGITRELCNQIKGVLRPVAPETQTPISDVNKMSPTAPLAVSLQNEVEKVENNIAYLNSIIALLEL